MKELETDFFARMAYQLDEKPSIEQSQSDRKSRYQERLNRPKSLDWEKKRVKKKFIYTTSDESDDEMPAAKPKVKKQAVENKEKKQKIIEIWLEDDTEVQPSSSQQLKSRNKENGEQIEEEPHEENVYSVQLRGRLPSWYHTRLAERNAEKLKNAEKKEIRLKIEKEREEKEQKEEEKERKRFLKRESYYARKLEKQMKSVTENLQLRIKDTDKDDKKSKKMKKKAVEQAEKSANGTPIETVAENKKKRRRVPQQKITDPSIDPNAISLDAPDIAPWAKRKPPQRKIVETASEIQHPTPPTSPSDEFQQQEDQVLLDAERLLLPNLYSNDFLVTGDVEQTTTNQTEVVFDIGEEALYFEATGDLLDIPDEQIEMIDPNEEIDDNFLSIINDDTCDIQDYFDNVLE